MLSAFVFYFVLLSVLSFILFGVDKKIAHNSGRRLSERNLLLVTLLGGTAGSALGMLVFRHKISKTLFLFKIIVIIILQILFYIYYIK